MSDDFYAFAEEVRVRPGVGGALRALRQRDGKVDVSLVAPQGVSASVYMTIGEICEFAIGVLALMPMESGLEIGELIEERRAVSPADTTEGTG